MKTVLEPTIRFQRNGSGRVWYEVMVAGVFQSSQIVAETREKLMIAV